MSFTLGRNCKLYYKTGGVADSASFTEVTNIKDVTLNLTSDEADVTTRGSGGWKQTAQALRDASVSFEMEWDTSASDFQAFLDAFTGATTIGVAVMDGDYSTPGSEGFEADMTVTEFTRSEPLNDSAKASVTIKPTYSATAPTWTIII